MKNILKLFLVFFVLFVSSAVYADFCVSCGTQLPDEANFCPKCGKTVESASVEETRISTDESDETEEEEDSTAALDEVKVLISFLTVAETRAGSERVESMYRLVSSPLLVCQNQTFQPYELPGANGTRYGFTLPVEMSGKGFYIAFRADRRKYQFASFGKWCGKDYKLANSFINPDSDGFYNYCIPVKSSHGSYYEEVMFALCDKTELKEFIAEYRRDRKEAARKKAIEEAEKRRRQMALERSKQQSQPGAPSPAPAPAPAPKAPGKNEQPKRPAAPRGSIVAVEEDYLSTIEASAF